MPLRQTSAGGRFALRGRALLQGAQFLCWAKKSGCIGVAQPASFITPGTPLMKSLFPR